MSAESSQADILVAALPQEKPSDLMRCFLTVLPGLGTRTIKQLFRVFRDAFTGEDLVSKILENGFAENRNAAEQKGQQMLDARLIHNLIGFKDPCKDKEKCILSISLKGKIILYGEQFLKPSIDDIFEDGAIDYGSLKSQFSIIKIHEVVVKNEFLEALVFRMISNPSLFLSEYSDHVLTQGLTGQSIATKDRNSKRGNYLCKNSFRVSDAIEWFLANTNIESKSQAAIFGEFMSRRGIIKAVSPSPVHGESFNEATECAFYLSRGSKGATPESSTLGGSEGNFQIGNNNSVSNTTLHQNSKSNPSPENNYSRRNLLLQIIDNPDSCRVFESFLSSIYCSENLLFYLMVRTYKQTFVKTKSGETETFTPDPKSSLLVAKQISDKYLRGESLNVEQSAKKSVRSEIDKDSLAKFIKTKSYMDLELNSMDQTIIAEPIGFNNSGKHLAI